VAALHIMMYHRITTHSQQSHQAGEPANLLIAHMEMIHRSLVPYGDAIPYRIVPPIFAFILPLFHYRAAITILFY